MLKCYFKRLLYAAVLIALSAFADNRVDFFRAVAIDNDRSVSALLRDGFDPNVRDERGQGALFLALREGSLRVADVLLAQPTIDIDAANEAGETPLMIAALAGGSSVHACSTRSGVTATMTRCIRRPAAPMW